MSEETGDEKKRGEDTGDKPTESPEESESKPRYKYCVVPGCRSTTNRTPHKLFFSMPTGERRRAWCSAMRRCAPQHKPLSAKCNRFCCEDHFDLEKDMENYMQWKIMGSEKTKKLILKKDVVPHKFDFRDEEKSDAVKKQEEKTRDKIIEEILSAKEAQEKQMEVTLRQRVSSKRIKLNLKRKLLADAALRSIQELQTTPPVSEEEKISEQLKKIKRIPHAVQERENAQEKEAEIEKYTFHIKVEADEDNHSNEGDTQAFIFHEFSSAPDSCNSLDVNVKVEESNDELEPEVLGQEIVLGL